jgi:hypothetical protein
MLVNVSGLLVSCFYEHLRPLLQRVYHILRRELLQGCGCTLQWGRGHTWQRQVTETAWANNSCDA